jgi:hypothetical protein
MLVGLPYERLGALVTDAALQAASAFTRASRAGAIDAIDPRHNRIRPHRPQTNGTTEGDRAARRDSQ